MKIHFPDQQPTPAPMPRPLPASFSTAELLSDSAIYRRTALGQRALLRIDDRLASPALRILARLNGYTDLRRLIDLSPGDARDMAHAIQRLYAEGLIERVDDEAEDVSAWRRARP